MRGPAPALSGRALAVAVAVLAALSLSGCSRANKAADAPAGAGVVAHIHVFQFTPKPLKVKAGTTVTWVNDDDLTHTVTSGTREYAPGDTGQVRAVHADGLFDLTLDGEGRKASYTFAKAGTFHYFCNRHPGMEADVVVS